VTSLRARLSLTIVCFVFGIALVLQLRTETRLRELVASDSSNDLSAIAAGLYDSNSALRTAADKLQQERQSNSRALDAGNLAQLDAELQTLKAFNGAVAVTGPGVELTVDADVRPVDLLDLLNEFRNAGAEALSIGGQRVVFNSAIRGSPGKLEINGVLIRSPVVVDAVGPAEVLDRALARKGGMLSYLRTSYPKASIDLQTKDSVSLPAYTQPVPIKPAG